MKRQPRSLDRVIGAKVYSRPSQSRKQANIALGRNVPLNDIQRAFVVDLCSGRGYGVHWQPVKQRSGQSIRILKVDVTKSVKKPELAKVLLARDNSGVSHRNNWLFQAEGKTNLK